MKRFALLGVVVSFLVVTGCNTTPPPAPPTPPAPPPAPPTAPNISGTYSGDVEFLTCFPGQQATATLTLSEDQTTTAKDDYFGSLKTPEATIFVKAFNDGINLSNFTIFSTEGQGGFISFKVVRGASGALVGTFSVSATVGTCRDSATAAEATGRVTFVP
jgi:hypothetical protein